MAPPRSAAGPTPGRARLLATSGRWRWVLVAALVLGTIALLASANDRSQVSRETPTPLTWPQELVSAEDEERSVVQLRALDNRSVCWTGSGVTFGAPDIVVTNHHVAISDASCVVSELQVWLSTRGNRDVQLAYTATIIGADQAADLAVLRVLPIGGAIPLLIPVELAPEPRLGDDLMVLGFPSAGGSSLTVSRGIVSGFLSQQGIDWIKTDAAVSGGSSGGPALNDAGQLVGLVTRFNISEAGDTVALLAPGTTIADLIRQSLGND